jgi:hypothetical protein
MHQNAECHQVAGITDNIILKYVLTALNTFNLHSHLRSIFEIQNTSSGLLLRCRNVLHVKSDKLNLVSQSPSLTQILAARAGKKLPNIFFIL